MVADGSGEVAEWRFVKQWETRKSSMFLEWLICVAAWRFVLMKTMKSSKFECA